MSSKAYHNTTVGGNARLHAGDVYGNVTNSNPEIERHNYTLERSVSSTPPTRVLAPPSSADHDRFVKAVLEGQNEARLRYLLAQGADVDAKDAITGLAALYYASRRGDCENVRFLLSAGADVNTWNDSFGAPVHVAALKGHVEVINILLRHKANVELSNNKLGTAMHCAYFGGRSAIVRAIGEAGMSLGLENTWSEISPTFMRTLAYDMPTQAPNIQRHEEDPWRELRFESLPLLLASESSSPFTIWPTNLVDKDCWTSFQSGLFARKATLLMWAARCQDLHLIEHLLQRGASVWMQDDDGWTAIHHAVFNFVEIRPGSANACIERLLSAGSRLDIRTKSGLTPLMLAVHSTLCSPDNIDMLCEHGAAVDLVDSYGRSVLHLALMQNSSEAIITCLLEHRTDANASDDRNGLYPPLVIAVQHKAPSDIIATLLKHGANLLLVYNLPGEVVDEVFMYLRYLVYDCHVTLPIVVMDAIKPHTSRRGISWQSLRSL